jgi:7-cyano-7-deazaguanine reductase
MSDDPNFDHALELMRTLEVDDRKKVFAQLRKERLETEAAKKEELKLLPNSHWSKAHILRRIPNPTDAAYEQKIYMPEFTFVGTMNQPDFGECLLTFYPNEWTIELKSLKKYKDAFRGAMASYERLANVMYEDLMNVYDPIRLRLMMRLRPRGGISSCLTIDSDWSIRGGKEEFQDWQSNTDRFGFDVANAVTL